ncbi:MAG: CPBP family intramembrane glutamic endopeptidase [Thermoplasmatota archaeon]
MKNKPVINWKIFWILYTASIIGIIAIMPYALTLQADLLKDISFPMSFLIAISIGQSALMFFFLTFVGLYLSEKTGFDIPLIKHFLHKKELKEKLGSLIGISIGFGILAAVLIIAGDYILALIQPTSLNQSNTIPPVWQGFLTSFYGGINEEIMLRLFFMSFLVFLFIKIKKTSDGQASSLVIWIAILISATLFGLLHLPFTASITTITPVIILRAIILNAIGGIIFGWLYWKKGLESAMISHFSADIVLHAILPLFLL